MTEFGWTLIHFIEIEIDKLAMVLDALESDVNSLNELIRFEPAERPPSLDQIREFTHNRFSDKWIKYMYAKFKNVRFCAAFNGAYFDISRHT